MDNNQEETKQETKKERNIRNNENNIRNAAEVGKAVGGWAAAAGTAVQIADKVSNGKSTEKLAKQLNTANKIVPGGRTGQRLLNKASESGTANAAGDIASKKNLSNNQNLQKNNSDALKNNVNTNEKNNSTDNNSNNLNSDNLESDNSSDNNKEPQKKIGGSKSLFSKKGFLFKIIGIGGIVMFIIFMCIIIVILMSLGIIEVDSADFINPSSNENNNQTNYYFTEISDNIDYWWPIGSIETTTTNGKTYATGNPNSINITAYFAGNDNTHNGNHGALDIGAVVGSDNVIAAKSGTVIYPTANDSVNYPNGCYSKTPGCTHFSDGGGFGNHIMIQHDDGIVTIYAHMYENTIKLRAGDTVSQGQVLGKTGTSGNSTGGHLHFEMRLNGTKVDPLNYVSTTNPRPVSKNNDDKEEGETNE